MLKNIRKTIASAESVQIHLSGEKNILDFPEFSDIEKARTLFNTLRKRTLCSISLARPEKDRRTFRSEPRTSWKK